MGSAPCSSPYTSGFPQSASHVAGAEVVGGDELIASIAEAGAGGIRFDKCLATPDMAAKLGRIARVRVGRPFLHVPTALTKTTHLILSPAAVHLQPRADQPSVHLPVV